MSDVGERGCKIFMVWVFNRRIWWLPQFGTWILFHVWLISVHSSDISPLQTMTMRKNTLIVPLMNRHTATQVKLGTKADDSHECCRNESSFPIGRARWYKMMRVKRWQLQIHETSQISMFYLCTEFWSDIHGLPRLRWSIWIGICRKSKRHIFVTEWNGRLIC